MTLVSRAAPDPSVRLGVVGEAFGLGTSDDPSVADDRFDFAAVSLDSFDADSVDGVVADAAVLSASPERLLAAVPRDLPLVSIGETDTVPVTDDLLGALDAHVVYDGGFESLGATLNDVFDRRRSNLGMSPGELLEQLFAEVPIHMYLKDRAGRHVRVSEHMFDPDELLGKRDIDVIDDPSLARRAYENDMTVMETGEPALRLEEFNEVRNDWALTSKVPIRNEGEVVGLAGVTWIITKRKEYQQRLERQNDRLEQFAGILSHDLRNPLMVAMGRLDHLRSEGTDDQAAEEYLATIERHLERMDAIIDDVLTITRQGEHIEETEPVSLDAIATECWDGVQTGSATMRVDDWQFRADPDRLRNVFENLFRNAVEHGSPNPDSQARQDAVEHGGEDVTVRVGSLSDGDGFYVADDGPGIPADERERIFERGYTTSDDGTGLGLEIVRQIVDAHDWAIDVTESQRDGTRFEISGVDRLA